MKSYHVGAQKQAGTYWLVIENNDGHYRSVSKYRERTAAVKAADNLNNQQQGADGGAWLFDTETIRIGAI